MSLAEMIFKILSTGTPILSVLAVGATAIYQTKCNTKVLLKQIRPKPIAHGCRVCNLDVYTYFDEDNKTSEPACVYLELNNSKSCNFDPTKDDDEKRKIDAIEMKKLNNGKCYLSLWGSKVT